MGFPLPADDADVPLPGSRARLAWFAAGVLVTVYGVGEFVRWVLVGWNGNDWWGIDHEMEVDAGARLLAGQPIYANEKFLYPPAAAVLGAPLSLLPFDLVSVGYAVAKLVVAAICVNALADGRSAGIKTFATITLIATLPFAHDVMLGNANVVLVASMVPAVFGADRRRNGVLLGVTVALFAKPFVVPILLWLLVWRRRTLQGVVVAGLALTAVCGIVVGPGAYQAWIQALAGGTRYASVFAGNHGVTALFPQLWLPVAAVTALGLLVVVRRRGPLPSLTWAVTCGLLLAPYAGTYAALPIALAIPGLVGAAPMLALGIVAASPVATTHPLPIYAALIMLLSLRLADEAPLRGAATRPVGMPDTGPSTVATPARVGSDHARTAVAR